MFALNTNNDLPPQWHGLHGIDNKVCQYLLYLTVIHLHKSRFIFTRQTQRNILFFTGAIFSLRNLMLPVPIEDSYSRSYPNDVI